MFTSTLTLMLAVCDLSGSFAEKTGWEKPAEAFVAEHQADGFRFADAKKNIANCLRRGGCTWEGLEVWEARVYYREGAAVRVEMSLYNRGDDRSGTPKTAADLKTLLDQIAERAEPGGKIGSNPEKKKLPSGGYQFQRRFTKGANDVGKARQPWKLGNTAESRVGGGVITTASPPTRQHWQLNNREPGPSNA